MTLICPLRETPVNTILLDGVLYCLLATDLLPLLLEEGEGEEGEGEGRTTTGEDDCAEDITSACVRVCMCVCERERVYE